MAVNILQFVLDLYRKFPGSYFLYLVKLKLGFTFFVRIIFGSLGHHPQCFKCVKFLIEIVMEAVIH